MKEIVFTNISDLIIEPPKPASKHIPDWYKQLSAFEGGEKKPDGLGNTTATIKKCIPVLDALTAGYIITTPVDFFVTQRDGIPWYEWPTGDAITFHPVHQALNHPLDIGSPYPKFSSPWGIKTPIGYSVLFTAPFHRESVFKVLDGIVDTDTYFNPVNFPFQLLDSKFEGLIPQGTPMVQVIPFKRESWKMRNGAEKDKEDVLKVRNVIVQKFFDKYKNTFWAKKDFR